MHVFYACVVFLLYHIFWTLFHVSCMYYASLSLILNITCVLLIYEYVIS